MKRYIKLSILVIACIFAHTVIALSQAPEPLSSSNMASFTQVQQALSSIDTLSGQFKQVQHIPLLSSPLVSQGQFSLSKSKGLIWQQKTPFTSLLILNDKEFIQKLGNTPETVITKEQQPVMFSFAHIFLSLFNGNISDVQQYFTILFSGSTTNWQIKLIPKTSPLNQAINTIELDGNKYINHVVVKQKNDNETIVDFSGIH